MTQRPTTQRPTRVQPPRNRPTTQPATTRRQGRAIDQHRPVRSCIGCRTRRPAHELVRVTRSVRDGSTAFEVDGVSNGRGAWLCRSDGGTASLACLDAAVAARQFARAWRTTLDTPDIDAIRRAIGDSHTDE